MSPFTARNSVTAAKASARHWATSTAVSSAKLSAPNADNKATTVITVRSQEPGPPDLHAGPKLRHRQRADDHPNIHDWMPLLEPQPFADSSDERPQRRDRPRERRVSQEGCPSRYARSSPA